MNFQIYVVDCETTGLDEIKNDPIEISIYRLSDGSQNTWFLRPVNLENIDAAALRVSGYNIDDIRGITKQGKEKYLPADKQLVSIENWLNDDNCSATNRMIVGQNVDFDKKMLQELWKKCNSFDTFPFSERFKLDTMQIEIFMDFCKGQFAEGYSLNALGKKYGVKNEKAHTASEDVKTTVGIFTKQVEIGRAAFKKE